MRCKFNLPIERCDKCGKSFMSQSELQRHKMWEHPVPVSPFEERFAAPANRAVSPEDLHKLTTDVIADGNKATNRSTLIGDGRRRVPFGPFRI